MTATRPSGAPYGPEGAETGSEVGPDGDGPPQGDTALRDEWAASALAHAAANPRITVDRSDLIAALIPISVYIDRTPDDDTAEYLTGVLARFRAALDPSEAR